jgi:protein-S-isoprenylcysteine O-methyltransferase Ste14
MVAPRVPGRRYLEPNPMYLGAVILVAGVAVPLGSLIALLVVAFFVIL